MAPMSAPTTSFRFGYALGTLTREFLRSIKRPARLAPVQTQPAPILASAFQARNDWDELSKTPTIARRGIDLNRWYEENTTQAKPMKPKRKRSNARKAPAPAALFVGPLPKFGSLNELIA
ncbi:MULTISPECIES: hypothetical protein [unclassified Pseudomonas]|uniref:hypothetical protein n=1 Tax=unclassified Pseudomonas TaxID=196821 RepID=UPI000778A842|nr:MULTISPECIES: hypothetical protein [unclassified Pseudomonas]KYC14114.1 hypothetical protein WM94_28450 [Pseudomonas sp. ABFPK]